MAGTRCVERDGVAVPAGFALSPAIDSASVRALLGTELGDLTLFAPAGTWDRITAGDFVAATRAAARATAAQARSTSARSPSTV